MKSLLALCVLLFAVTTRAEAVYVTTHRSQADVVVYVSTSEGSPIWKAPRATAMVKGCGWWFTQDASVADVVVFFTRHKSQAQVIIHFVPHRRDACRLHP